MSVDQVARVAERDERVVDGLGSERPEHHRQRDDRAGEDDPLEPRAGHAPIIHSPWPLSPVWSRKGPWSTKTRTRTSQPPPRPRPKPKSQRPSPRLRAA